MDELKSKAEDVLRNHLLRCFNDILEKFPDLADMSKEDAVEHLLNLRRQRKIKITLNTVDNLMKTKIDWIS